MDKSTDPADYQHVARPVAAMAKAFASGHYIAPHTHPRAQLIFATEGVMEITTAQATWIAPTGRAVWVPGDVEHAVRMMGRVAMRTLYIEPAASQSAPSQCEVIEVSALLRALILEAVALPVDYDDGGRGGLIMRLILEELRTLDLVPLHVPMPRDPRLRRICRALIKEPGRTETLDAWGIQVGATARTLANHFKAETGLTFGRWREQARLVEAVRRLALKQSVAVIAQDLGYRSESAFIVMFRRALGRTPARYFDRLRGGDGAR